MHNMKRRAMIGCIFAIFLLELMGGAHSEESQVIVNLMLDADISPMPTTEQEQMAESSLINLSNEIDPRGINATIFVSESLVSAYRLGITLQGTMPNHELALYGNNTGERLSSLSSDEQNRVLTKARDMLHSCYVCGGKHVDIRGFRPQGFDQNEDTLRILENLGFVYDAGFQSGITYAPGHEDDAWPYPIDGHKLYAVPVSTHSFEGEQVYLYDRYAKEEKRLSGTEWYDLLVDEFNESADAREPVVVIFSNLISGEGDYLDSYRGFLEYAKSRGAKFVTTMQLVDMVATSPSGEQLPQNLSAGEAAQIKSSEMINATIQRKNYCPTCIQSSNNSTNYSLDSP